MNAHALAQKKAKPAWACVNAYCRRRPSLGYKTCRKCRTYHRKYREANR